jgi:hypothetical protein
VRTDKKPLQKADKKTPSRVPKRGVVGYSKKSALLEEAIIQMNTGKYGRSSAVLKELLSLDPHNTEARRLFATLHLRLGSLVTARQAFESLAHEAVGRQDFWLAESLLREYLAAGPRCVPFLELLAHVYEEKGDAVAAVAELGKAIDILIESPDSENSKKPAELYAKVRELAPVSAVAFQFSSLFDIQTGEFIGPPPVTPTAVTSLEVDHSKLQDESPSAIEESRLSEVMPWEQLDGAPPSPEASPLISSNPVIESFDIPDILMNPPPVGLASQNLEVPSSESAGSIPEAHLLDQDVPLILVEPSFPLSGFLSNETEDSLIERSPFVEGGLAASSSEECTADIESVVTASVESSGLSSPMPWEQVENSTIKIEEADPPTAPFVQADGVPLVSNESSLALPATAQPEYVSDQLPNLVPALDLMEPRESIIAVEPSTSSVVLSEPEGPALSAAEPSPMVPFSWSSVFDGARNCAVGTSSLSAPIELSTPGTSLQDAQELESVQPESVSEPERSFPFSTPTPELLRALGDPEPLPLAHASTLSEVSEPIAETDAIRESDLLWPTPVFHSEEPSRPEEAPPFSSDIPSLFEVEVPVPPPSEPIKPVREPEPISPLSFMEVQPVALVTEASSPEPSSLPMITEAPLAPEAVSTEHREIPAILFREATVPPLSAAPSDASSASLDSIDTPSHWSTGEAEVQPHRPTDKKRNWDKEKGEAPVVPSTPLPLVEELPEPVAELSRSGGWESAPSEVAASVVEAVAPVVEKVVLQEDTRPEWVRASESITFVNLPASPPTTWQEADSESIHSKLEPGLSVAASAVDVLFDSTREKSHLHTQDRLSSPRPRPRFATRVARVRIGISSFIGSCFSTTRSIALLCLGLALFLVVLVVVGIGAVGLIWMAMEAPPSSAYQSLTTNPSRALTDSKQNGYLLLLGFDASAEQDPLQSGYEGEVERNNPQAANACMLSDEGKGTMTGASAIVVREWFAGVDPAAQMKTQAAAVRSWVAQESLVIRRYQQWLSMPFEDVGYGKILSPNCAHILQSHRLYLAEGFGQDLSTGLGRLETDMRSWRTALGQSKTLMVKMLAVTAVQDNVAIASGLLTRQDLDGSAIARLGKMVRPFDQVELSLRWPMQSHLVWATQSVSTSLKNDKEMERPLYVALAAAMPLPVQRRSNAYADYYEAASKAVAEGRYTNLPKRSSFIQTSAVSVVDYVANPIEHIIGIDPLPSWDPYVGRMVETDARLRLASLQVWIRRGPQQEGNVLTRLAKAGQTHYDPFTGLPMLVNQQRGVMYSVGQDGKDQEGDPLRDVVATIPTTQSVVTESSRSVSLPRSK